MKLILKLLHTLALGHAGKKKVFQGEFQCFRARLNTLICDGGGATTPLGITRIVCHAFRGSGAYPSLQLKMHK